MDKKQLLIKFLEWLYKTSEAEPMKLETDIDDIVDMFLNKE